MSYSLALVPPMNAMRVPSGDQAGYSTYASVAIRRRWDPSGFMRKPPMGSPSRSELNTMVRPSGDQSGPQSFPGSLVRFLAPVPSAPTT